MSAYINLGYPKIKSIHLSTGDKQLASDLLKHLGFEETDRRSLRLPGHVLEIALIESDQTDSISVLELLFSNPNEAKLEILKWAQDQNLSRGLRDNIVVIEELLPLKISVV